MKKKSALFVPKCPSAFGEREVDADEDKEDARRKENARGERMEDEKNESMPYNESDPI